MPDVKQETAKPSAASTTEPVKKSKAWLFLAILMLAEGVGVFFVGKMFSAAPLPAEAGEHPATAAEAGTPTEMSPGTNDIGEVTLSDSKTFNKETGKMVFIHLRVAVLVPAPEVERVKKLVESMQGRIDDRINTVIRGADPKHFNEPSLETIKRRIKYEADRVFEDENLIRDVLIPYLVQSSPGL